MKRVLEESLAQREAEALDRVRVAARDLKDAVVAAGRRVVATHPWALPSVGFSAGLLAPFLIPARDPVRQTWATFRDGPEEGTRSIREEIRAIAVVALTEAFAVIAERLLVKEGSCKPGERS